MFILSVCKIRILLKSVGFYWLIWLQKQGYPHVGCVRFLAAPLCLTLRFLVGGFSQTSCCPQTRTILVANTKQPWLFLRRAALRRGLAGMNPFYLLLCGFWCQHQSAVPVSPVPDASTNLQFLSHLSLMCFWGLLVVNLSLLHHWGQQDQQFWQCCVCWGRQIELTLLKLYFRPSHIPSGLFPPSTGQGFPSMLLPYTPLSPAVMLAASFVCSPLFPRSVLYQDSLSQELSSMSELSCAILAQQKRAELAQGVQGRILLLRSIWAHWMSHRFLLLRRAILSAVYFMFFPSFVLGV